MTTETAPRTSATVIHEGALIRATNHHQRSWARAFAAADACGIGQQVLIDATAKLGTGESSALMLSGRQCSGKDTVGPLALQLGGVRDHDTMRFGVGDVIKRRANLILEMIRETGTPAEAASAVVGRFNMRAEHALHLVSVLGPADEEASRTGERLHAYSRTPAMRHALQYLGNEAHRDEDPAYWARSCFAELVPLLASGAHVLMADGRFEDEVSLASDLGIFVARLYVTEEVQLARLWLRDGIEPDRAALAHPGESALEDHRVFDMIVDNSSAPEAVAAAAVAAGWASHRSRMAYELPV